MDDTYFNTPDSIANNCDSCNKVFDTFEKKYSMIEHYEPTCFSFEFNEEVTLCEDCYTKQSKNIIKENES